MCFINVITGGQVQTMVRCRDSDIARARQLARKLIKCLQVSELGLCWQPKSHKFKGGVMPLQSAASESQRG